MTATIEPAVVDSSSSPRRTATVTATLPLGGGRLVVRPIEPEDGDRQVTSSFTDGVAETRMDISDV